MDNVVDARGLTCPQPVILTKKALEQLQDGAVVTVVNDRTALENVIKLAKSMAYEVDVEEKGEEYHIHIGKGVDMTQSDLDHYEGAVFVIKSQFLGEGESELGRTLMKSFFYTLTQMGRAASTIIFMNSGVALSTQGSEIIEHLQALEQSGVEILSCGTCLDFYNLKQMLMVGQVSNMYNILDKMSSGHKVITL